MKGLLLGDNYAYGSGYSKATYRKIIHNLIDTWGDISNHSGPHISIVVDFVL